MNTATAIEREHKSSFRETVIECSKFQRPNPLTSVWQLANTFIPFFVLIVAMYYSLSSSYWITLGLGVIAGGFMLRIFMIQHDCGHGSFYRSRKVNDAVGCFCSLFTLIPYFYWRRQHALHHSANGNLDHRGHGDIDLYTVREYLALTNWQRIKFRLARNPVMFLVFGPIWLLLGMNRFAFDKVKTSKREIHNVYMTNAAGVVFFVLFGLLFGFWNVLVIALPIFLISAAAGIWLFYIQHQFEHTYWKHDQEWDYFDAAVHGSSFYKLPKILDWFTASIGYHHIHHLMPLIPNYYLRKCAETNPQFQEGVHTFTLFGGFGVLNLSLWDEEEQRLISFRDLRKKIRSNHSPAMG